MNRGKVAFYGSLAFCAVSFVFVHWKKENDRLEMNVAVCKDKDRMLRRFEEHGAQSSPDWQQPGTASASVSAKE